jgi:hypothetical protein
MIRGREDDVETQDTEKRKATIECPEDDVETQDTKKRKATIECPEEGPESEGLSEEAQERHWQKRLEARKMRSQKHREWAERMYGPYDLPSPPEYKNGIIPEHLRLTRERMELLKEKNRLRRAGVIFPITLGQGSIPSDIVNGAHIITSGSMHMTHATRTHR